jgi:signal transduction histidine kinase
MTSLGGLAAGLAHEINNPLGIITQAVQNVEQRTSPELAANRAAAATAGTDIEAVRAYHETREIPAFLKDIREAAGRAAHIVTSMLEFSRTGDTVRVPADLAQLLDVSLLFAASDLDLKKRYRFREIETIRQYATDVPAVPVARVEIEQVFLNLLTNAVHAVSTNPPERAPRIVLRLFREEKYAVVQIIDNGPGMATATQRRVFEPFFTTKPPGMGTGLGLSLAYTIVTHSHRGLIEVDSSPDHGARFTVRLPLASADDGMARPAATPRRRA